MAAALTLSALMLLLTEASTVNVVLVLSVCLLLSSHVLIMRDNDNDWSRHVLIIMSREES